MPNSKRRKPKSAPQHRPVSTLQRFLGMAHFYEQNPRCTVTFPFDGETCVVTYKPTVPLLSQLRRVSMMGWGTGRFAALSSLLAAHIIGWNLEQNGTPVPITGEAIVQLQARWLQRMAKAIAADLQERAQRYANEMQDAGVANQKGGAS